MFSGFVSLKIDLSTFLTLTDHDLKELGISTFGARRKMLMAIAGRSCVCANEIFRETYLSRYKINSAGTHPPHSSNYLHSTPLEPVWVKLKSSAPPKLNSPHSTQFMQHNLQNFWSRSRAVYRFWSSFYFVLTQLIVALSFPFRFEQEGDADGCCSRS